MRTNDYRFQEVAERVGFARLYEIIGVKLVGRLSCETCGYEIPLQRGQAAVYLKHGWPKCCGYTMTLVPRGAA